MNRPPEWIVGGPAGDDSEHPPEYLVHTAAPRFVCRVVDEGDPEEAPWSIDGLTYGDTGSLLLCEFVWIDEPPAGGDLVALLVRARDALL